MRLLEQIDAAGWLGFDIWDFAARSLSRPYGRSFLRPVLRRHPLRFLAGLRMYRRQIRPARQPGYAPVGFSSWEELQRDLGEGAWLVGVGFCQKPLDPACPSGRPNHLCRLLTQSSSEPVAAACRVCEIREIARGALAAGAGLYIMTSAADIAQDLLLPALRGDGASRVVLSVCPYSVPPLTLAMSICGVRGMVQSYGEGDCRDFATWLRADEGDKRELTRLVPGGHGRLLALLDHVAAARRARGAPMTSHFRQAGNLYLPSE